MYSMANNVWLKFAKVKYPTLGPDSPEYGKLRHAFFTGIWAMMGFAEHINRHHGHLANTMFRDLVEECQVVLKPDEFHNIGEIIVPRNGK